MPRHAVEIPLWDDKERTTRPFSFTYDTKEQGVIVLTYQDANPVPKDKKRYTTKPKYYWIELTQDAYPIMVRYAHNQKDNLYQRDKDKKIIDYYLFRANHEHPNESTYGGNNPDYNLRRLEEMVFYHYVRLFGIDYCRCPQLTKEELTEADRDWHIQKAFDNNDYVGLLHPDW